MEDEYEEIDDGRVQYPLPQEIDPMGLFHSLRKLKILNADVFMRMQAFNLTTVDTFLTELEYSNLRELHTLERTPPDTHFLGAQSQMWIFAAYELLRTWQERCKKIVKWSETGGLQQKLEALKQKHDGSTHYGLENHIQQLESVIADPSIIDHIRGELLHMHIPFTRLEFIRVAIAKHEVSGKAKAIAFFPGYGRINMHCGSLDYQLDNGPIILGMINRRDIADSIRAIDLDSLPPSPDDLASFDKFMSGKFT
jgi:hypothetical protein